MEKYFENRIANIKKELQLRDLNNLIILKDENIYYLTGFYGKDSGSILLFINEDIYLLVHFIYFEQAKKTVIPRNIKIIQYLRDKYKKLAEIIKDYNLRNIVIEGQNISYDSFQSLQDILSVEINEKTARKLKLLSVSGIVENLRMIKDEFELSNLEKACSITDRVFNQISKLKLAKLKSFTEIELAYKVEIGTVKYGSEGKSFDYVIASNNSSALPHYKASNKKITDGILLMDIGCKFSHYCSDMTRTVFCGGKNDDKLIKIYDIVLQAQIKALEACKEGVSCRELDSIARDFIEKKGFGKNFGHGLGHGVGLEVHEMPWVSYTDDIILKENMVITIEPGIYIENYGGVRIEDMIILKKNGFKNLYRSKKLLTAINR
jgi:Xaa-Pro aminopeptidase